MERIAVDSSQIAAVGHDPLADVMEIQFRTGGVYRYAGVSLALFQGFLSAESHGKFFGEHIKRLPTTRLENGEFVKLAEARASARSVEFIRKLVAEAGIDTVTSCSRIGVMWRPTIERIGIVFAEVEGQNVESFLAGLLQSQASAMIDWLKRSSSW